MHLHLALFAVGLLFAGCASSAAPIAVDGNATLAAGTNYKEINIHLDEGKRVEWSWTATGGAAHFNVHSHKDGQVTEHVLRHAAADSGHFAAPARGEHSLMWQNPGTTTVDVHYGVRVYGTVTSQAP